MAVNSKPAVEGCFDQSGIQRSGCATRIYPTKRILVLYLHNNQISRIEKLGAFTHLTHLYLQWNNIRKVENLDSLKNLKQLYLGYNKIARLENLGNLKKLEQVHVERQLLEGAARFEFDADCMKALANHLKVLNIKKLKLTHMTALEPLWKLEVLLASENNFKTTEDINPVISALYSLRVLDLQGCFAQKDVHYREKITAAAGHKLLLLDGKMISQSTRNFIKNFQTIKLEKKRRAVASEEEKAKTADNSKSSLDSGGGSAAAGGDAVFPCHIGAHFPANSLFQVTSRRQNGPKVPRKPVLRSPILLKTMSATFGDELLRRVQLRTDANAAVAGSDHGVMLQGKVMKAEIPVFKEKIRVQRKMQSLPSID
ncbi:protein phosphatase 1 regulatory subunit 42-like isoform X2 [Toxorhynchites rutilus septentrionalis]|uniref:protein phosphatase 1 regulatory subunit 42-like isoform X2 n=1 Tax=Toxorhynchites rutilus septentrionalis TaxID=329112 RepID=UPI00247ACF78|nr:protein phosphatase 1 regulatory subunit 42-like isoform X2 [Toxorhynchites rutilus septentrionalis]